MKKLLNLGPPDEAAVAKATEAFHKEAKLLDTWLSKQQQYLVGDELTLADFAVAAPLFYAKQGELPLGPTATCRSGSAASRRCRAGRRRHRRCRQPPPERHPATKNETGGRGRLLFILATRGEIRQRVGTGFSPR